MSVVNFLLLSYCTLDQDVVPGNMIELRAFVGQLGDQIDPKTSDKPY